MKEHVATIPELDHSFTRSSVQDITGQPYRLMLKYMSRSVINVSDSVTPMMAPWPFAQWGLDILGPFPTGTRQMKFLVVGIDYFIKWVEAEPLVKITQQNVKNFV